MRADRLLSLLMLLQARGRLTAGELARELEVSVRTVYRDLDALSAAGVPVYAERGPGGGCALLDSYRTTLTGLTPGEVRALFMLGIPAPLAELGVAEELKAALLKLAAALPDARRDDEAQARQRIHLDPTDWEENREPARHLRTAHQAVWERWRLKVTYALPFDAQVTWLVEPYGLVAKANAWYLVCVRHGQVCALEVARVLEAELTGVRFDAPADFNLAAFWQGWCAGVEKNRPRYRTAVRVAPGLLPWLPCLLGGATREALIQDGQPDERGWLPCALVFGSLEEARARLLGLGGALEVLSPSELRESVADFARQIVAVYDTSDS